MKTISPSDRNLHVYAITQTLNIIVYLITLRITVCDWGRGCYVIITLWTCCEKYFTATETYMFMPLHRHEIELCTLLPYA